MPKPLGGAAGGGGPMDMLVQFLPLVGCWSSLFYFLMIRPQQQRVKAHQTDARRPQARRHGGAVLAA